MFLFINTAVLSVSPKMTFSDTISNYNYCNCFVSIIAIFDFSVVRNTGIIDFEFNPL